MDLHLSIVGKFSFHIRRVFIKWEFAPPEWEAANHSKHNLPYPPLPIYKTIAYIGSPARPPDNSVWECATRWQQAIVLHIAHTRLSSIWCPLSRCPLSRCPCIIVSWTLWTWTMENICMGYWHCYSFMLWYGCSNATAWCYSLPEAATSGQHVYN